MKPCAAVVPWVAKAIDIMVAEFRRGTGAEFGTFDLHDVQAAFTRPVFVNHLTQNWLPALPDVQAKLANGEKVRIALAGEQGAVLVVDERTEDAFTVPTNEMEQFFYTFSTLHCLAVSMQHDGAGTGTVIRADTGHRYATEAGFSGFPGGL